MAYLELNGVSKHFGRLAALDKVDLEVAKGEIVGVVGPNGSGKTTLINVVSGYHYPTAGAIFFEGGQISNLRPDRIARRGVVRTFQSNVLYPTLTVLESLMVSASLQYQKGSLQSFFKTKAWAREEERVISRVLEIIGMVGMIDDLNAPADALSHGRQRLLGVALALCANPRVLLLDEPTTGMNYEESMFFVDKIRHINAQGVTVILIEHNMKVLLGLATRVACFSFGNKIADGKPEEVMGKQEVIEAYLGTEMI